MAEARPKVILADDHTIVLEGLRSLLEEEFDLVDTVDNGRALVDRVGELRPDVVVADISMPMLNGIEAARQLSQQFPNLRIIFLTMHREVAFVREAFRAGASGYLLKQSAASELVTAIREVLDGRNYITPHITKNIVDLFVDGDNEKTDPAERLTPRQREVLQLVAEGRTIKEIGAILGVSGKTVEFHKYRMMEQLGLRTTAELTQFAVKHGIVAP